jgi:uncharacterized membrane protein
VAEPAIWVIKRNCSASPRQLAGVFVSVVAVSFAFGVAFATQGLWMVLPFVGLEVLAVAAAFICYGRHAVDYERIDLQGGSMRVKRREGGRKTEVRFDAAWLRVEVGERSGAGCRVRVDLVSNGRRVEVGRYLVDEQRVALGRELRGALGALAQHGA